MDDFFGQHLQPIEVIDDHIGRRAFAQHAAIAKARHLRRQRRQPPVRLLERDHLMLAHDLAQGLGGVAPGGQEFGVGTSVGHPEQHVGIVDDLPQVLDAAVGWRGEELGLQVFFDGHVEHHVHRVLAHLLRSQGQRVVEPGAVLLEHRAGDHDAGQRAGCGGRHLVLERLPARRIAQLAQPFCVRAGGRLAPCLGVVEQVPFFEGEREAGVGCESLADHPDAAYAAAAHPGQHAAMDLGAMVECLHDIHDHRTPADLRHSS
jgi:hypothetical protein